MVAVITGDIINSRGVKDPSEWIKPLEKLLGKKNSPAKWEIFRGDSIQLLIENPEDALMEALMIKALIKSLAISGEKKRSTQLDIRMAIGIGTMDYHAKKITESNGTAFINSGEQFEQLKKSKNNLALRSPWPKLDEEVNLYLKLAAFNIDTWTTTSATTFLTVLKNRDKTQTELGSIWNISQNSVSYRLKRAGVDEMIVLIQLYNRKIKNYAYGHLD